MNRFLKVMWIVTVWLLVPLGLGSLGYYLIGPRIGQTGVVEKFVPELAKQKAARTAQPASNRAEEPDPLAAEPEKRNFVEPEVEVSVTRMDRRSSRDRRVSEEEEPRTDRTERTEGRSPTRASEPKPERAPKKAPVKPATEPKKEPPPSADPEKNDEGSVGGALPEGNTPPENPPPPETGAPG
ncbi:MAG TPA: hypothetical protein PLO61_03575 [Fimbriimonadaceae bacterium]|nr:hypothetical protein [Fimbriimonadaceae bacterium]HRJ32710.1 hypothetical protein [Fimbriimonadaceae bacterium]